MIKKINITYEKLVRDLISTTYSEVDINKSVIYIKDEQEKMHPISKSIFEIEIENKNIQQDTSIAGFLRTLATRTAYWSVRDILIDISNRLNDDETVELKDYLVAASALNRKGL